ncbi:MAG: CoB--CoM heterodisulfide reductase iron-sulfur subunit B family protein [Asgard group archaeon]|nr:CoB--CoM heterodisulfide reductase iron-sulfur subunit B family protein [Asgard group archaeon]
MVKKIGYYPGCTSKSYAKYLDSTARIVFRKLGIELEELSRWTCCGTFFGLADDNLTSQIAPIRNMIRAVEDGHSEITTICSMCYNTLKRANTLFKNDEEKAMRLNAFMYEEEDYQGEITVRHVLDLIAEKLTKTNLQPYLAKTLKGLKIAPYYGCTLLRPREISIDNNIEKPTILSDLIFSLGGEAIEDPYMTECCGSYLTVKDKHLVAERANKIISSMANRGAEIIMVSCPLCHFNLDRRQKEARELNSSLPRIPIVYFTQLMALAMGVPVEELGFEEHYINPLTLLRERGVINSKGKVPVKVTK